MFRLAALISLLFFFCVAGCASTSSTRSPAREYASTLDVTMELVDQALADASMEIEDSAQPGADSYVLVVRQMNASARGGATNSNPSLQSLHVTVRRVSPSRTSVRVDIPSSSYGATAAAQLRQRFLTALDRRAGRD